MDDIVSTSAFDWGDRSRWPKAFGGLVVAADVLYDKEVVTPLVDLLVYLDAPAIFVEPDNVERQSLGSVDYFQDMLKSNGLKFRTEKYFNPKQPSSPMLIISISCDCRVGRCKTLPKAQAFVTTSLDVKETKKKGSYS
ncbi:unnamed protein product [Durusdinium trenchii]|uniref:Uncharacterized protein n=1 Tax=Durusdinium trenchii TaxID=1381693 RepID=A0ABP0SDL4_9DINO